MNAITIKNTDETHNEQIKEKNPIDTISSPIDTLSSNKSLQKIQTFRHKLSEKLIEKISYFSKLHQYDDINQFKSAWNNWVQTDNISAMIHDEEKRLKQNYFSGDLIDKLFKSARYYYRKKQIQIDVYNQRFVTGYSDGGSLHIVGNIRTLIKTEEENKEQTEKEEQKEEQLKTNKILLQMSKTKSSLTLKTDISSLQSSVSSTPKSNSPTVSSGTISNYSSTLSSPFSSFSTKDSDTISHTSTTKTNKDHKIKLSKNLLQHIDNHINGIFKKNIEKDHVIQVSPATAYSQFCIDYKEDIANEIYYILKNNTIPIQPEKLSFRMKKTYKNRYFKLSNCLYK